MRALLLTLLLAHGLPALAAGAAGLPPCDQPVRFSAAWMADPELDTSKSAAELTALGAAAAKGGAPAPKGTQLGHVVVQTKLAVEPQTSCDGLLVRLDYVQPVLRVAREFPPDSCAYARVMNHERTHVRIHREIARQFSALDYPWRGASTATVLGFAKRELDRLMHAQRLFDSPEEYARNHSVCGGEISRLLKPAAG